ncbi:peptidyl-tRNA hydrolase [Gammaproteobacteria bacterium]
MAVRLIVGLGNPGPRYEETRHNAGFWVVDTLARAAGVKLRPEVRFLGEICRVVGHNGDDCWLLKPTTFMNHSGQAVAALSRFHKMAPSEILVVHDDLDLPPGIARLKNGGGHGGHNGLRDIIAHLGSEFSRLRLGIGHPGNARPVIDHVLDRPSHADETAIRDAIDAAIQVLPWVCAGQLQKAMNQLNGQRVSMVTIQKENPSHGI